MPVTRGGTDVYSRKGEESSCPRERVRAAALGLWEQFLPRKPNNQKKEIEKLKKPNGHGHCTPIAHI
jgi:hypothetical protein